MVYFNFIRASQSLNQSVCFHLVFCLGDKASLRLTALVILETVYKHRAHKDSWQEDREQWLKNEHESLVKTTKVGQVVKNGVDYTLVPEFSLRAL